MGTRKAGLLELLRRHPNWDEDAKAIVFTFDEGRGIQRDVVDEIAFTMEDLAVERIKDKQCLENFRIALRAAVNEYSSTLSEQTLEIIRTRGGIKCAEGQKTSRIIGKLCRSFGVDGHEHYNAVFAQLSDSLNPLQCIKRRCYLCTRVIFSKCLTRTTPGLPATISKAAAIRPVRCPI